MLFGGDSPTQKPRREPRLSQNHTPGRACLLRSIFDCLRVCKWLRWVCRARQQAMIIASELQTHVYQ